MNDFYVYAWRRPDTDVLFYIGKGRGKRDRTTDKRNPIFNRIFDKLTRQGLTPTISRIYEHLTEDDAFNLERLEISRHGRIDKCTGTLANLTDGGEGPSGFVQSEETRQKRSKSMAGVAKSDQHRANISAGTRGVKKSPEAIAKAADANRGKTRTPEILAKMSLSNTGKTLNGDHRDKISMAQRLAPPTGKNGTQFKGVSYDGTRRKFSASVRSRGRTSRIGRFDCAEDAARAYDAAASSIWGLGCYLNFPTTE